MTYRRGMIKVRDTILSHLYSTASRCNSGGLFLGESDVLFRSNNASCSETNPLQESKEIDDVVGASTAIHSGSYHRDGAEINNNARCVMLLLCCCRRPKGGGMRGNHMLQ
jgi:hypothetical protein